ncbi:MAG TPA: Fur family transcriptional regulator [Thermoanaerobaculia bacterium]|jgi:Fur family ferric uptake transcriptional regulator|nr:Fur family transcriptional regulator [Thermoanaerobaculia bacterium]
MADVREKDQFLQFLRGRGQRVTGERLALFEEIFSQHGHIDAEELLGAMKARGLKISRATVYRNLDLLVESGLATKQRLGSREFRYEHVHPGQHHDHLVCTGCGRVVEFVSPGIAALQAEICRAHGFVPMRHTLQITGLCNRCAENAASLETGMTPAVSAVRAAHV